MEVKEKEEIEVIRKQMRYFYLKLKKLEDVVQNLEQEIKTYQNKNKEEIIKENDKGAVMLVEEIENKNKEIEKVENKDEKLVEKERKEDGIKRKNRKHKQKKESKEQNKEQKKQKQRERKEIKEIKKNMKDLIKRVEDLEKKMNLQQNNILESELRIQKQKDAQFFTSVSNVIKNFIDFKLHIENLRNNIYTKQSNSFVVDSSFLSLFDNINYLFSQLGSFVKEKWLSFKIKKSLKEFKQTLSENVLNDERYALIYEYLNSSIKNDTEILQKIKNYFSEKDVKLIQLLKKIFTEGTIALKQEDINFYKEYIKQHLEKEKEEKKNLFNLNVEKNIENKKVKLNLRR